MNIAARASVLREAQRATTNHDRGCLTCRSRFRCELGARLYLRWHRILSGGQL